MAAQPTPPSVDEIGSRPFSFFPPIVNVDHNEWIYVSGNWSEVQIRNGKSGEEIWIPRNYLGDFSKVDEPVMILGLKRELEFKGGALWPYQRRVITMPPSPIAAPNQEPLPPPPPPELSLGSAAESGVGKLIAGLVLAAVIGFAALVFMFRRSTTGESIEYRGVLQADLGLTAKDDYFDVVRKLGPPDEDRWRPGTGERHYRALVYPKRKLAVILMGAERETALYIGAKDNGWRTVHAVELPGGVNTEPILRSLPRF